MPPTWVKTGQSLKSTGDGEQSSQGRKLETQADSEETHRNFLDGHYKNWTKELEERLNGLLELKQRLSKKKSDALRVKEHASLPTNNQEEPKFNKATRFLAESPEKHRNTVTSCANQALHDNFSKRASVSDGDCHVFDNAAHTGGAPTSSASATQLRRSGFVKYHTLWNSGSCSHLFSAKERGRNSSFHEVNQSKVLGASSGKSKHFY